MPVPTSNSLTDRINELENIVYGGQVIGGSPPAGVVVTNPAAGAVQVIAGPIQATSLIGTRQANTTNLSGSTDALAFPSDNYVTSAGVDAMTLATPVAGGPGVGDDGKTLTVTDVGGHAHIITTAANKIVPAHHLITFGGTAGAFVRLQAFGGLWYVQDSSGVTPS